jgi:asparaginyl-tRNA synthetase
MKSVLIKDIYRNTERYAGQAITIEGWIRTLRASKAFGFIEVNDGSFFRNLQVVFEKELENFVEISRLPISTAIRIKGELVLTPDAKQPFEIKATKIEIEGASDNDYPLQKKRHSFEFLREIAHLRPRSNTFSAVFRVRSLAAYAIHKFFQERDFVYVHHIFLQNT